MFSCILNKAHNLVTDCSEPVLRSYCKRTKITERLPPVVNIFDRFNDELKMISSLKRFQDFTRFESILEGKCTYTTETLGDFTIPDVYFVVD